MAVRFGAILPIIGPPDKVKALTQEITTTAKKAGAKVTLAEQSQIYDHSQRSFGALHEKVVIYTGPDAYRYADHQEKISQFRANLEAFFNRLYQEVGEPVHERDYRGRSVDYRESFGQYTDRVKAWVAQNPWPVYPDDADFTFNIPKGYKNGFNIDNPRSKTYQNVDQVETEFRAGSINLVS